MYNRLISGGISNIQGYITYVEVDSTSGLPYFAMVGLLASEVKEAGERVRSAIRNSGFSIQPGRITVSLTPGDIRKKGTGYDLAIAIGILLASKVIDITDNERQRLNNTLIIGELGLDGSVKGVDGVLPIILKAKREGYSSCIIPYDNAKETHMIEGMTIYLVHSLMEAIDAIHNRLKPYDNMVIGIKRSYSKFNIDSILGNEYAKRALLVSVSGMHNILFKGPPGAGKSMLAKCIPSIMPEPDMEEKIDIASIYSVCGLLRDDLSVIDRPFRMPHHSITLKAFTGGGVYPKPGEITLAHRGVLFLDELPEFRSEVLESLREPLEEKSINIVRNKGSCRFPADFLLVGAMNNCKCGYYPDRNICKCSELEVKRYINRIHGPLIDRIDICINISRVDIEDIEKGKRESASSGNKKKSEEFVHIVNKVLLVQKERFKNDNIRYNSQMDNEMVVKYCPMTDEAREMLRMAYSRMNLSVRIYYKIIKVARTIADIDDSMIIEERHIAEAIGYRSVV